MLHRCCQRPYKKCSSTVPLGPPKGKGPNPAGQSPTPQQPWSSASAQETARSAALPPIDASQHSKVSAPLPIETPRLAASISKSPVPRSRTLPRRPPAALAVAVGGCGPARADQTRGGAPAHRGGGPPGARP